MCLTWDPVSASNHPAGQYVTTGMGGLIGDNNQMSKKNPSFSADFRILVKERRKS
jgi:hypothetical protein